MGDAGTEILCFVSKKMRFLVASSAAKSGSFSVRASSIAGMNWIRLNGAVNVSGSS